MNRFDGFLRWAWSILVACTLAFTLGGCDGDDGAAGAAGPAGPTGGTGPTGPPGPPGPLPDDVMAAINAAEPESCGTCHADVGDGHQAIYDQYVDVSTLELQFTQGDVTTLDNGDGTMDIDVDFRILQDGMPFSDAAGLPSLDQKRFIFCHAIPENVDLWFLLCFSYIPDSFYLF